MPRFCLASLGETASDANTTAITYKTPANKPPKAGKIVNLSQFYSKGKDNLNQTVSFKSEKRLIQKNSLDLSAFN